VDHAAAGHRTPLDQDASVSGQGLERRRHRGATRPVDGRASQTGARASPSLGSRRETSCPGSQRQVVAQSHVPSELIHARASSIRVRGRRTRTPSPERKCLMLCVTSRRAPAPIAAARIGTSFASFAVVRCRAMDLDWNRAEEFFEERGGFRGLAAKFRRISATAASGSRDEGGQARQGPGSRGWRPCGTAVRRFRTSASTQTANGSVFSGRATQILQGQFSGSTEAFHFGGEPRYDEPNLLPLECGQIPDGFADSLLG
jgi:hypothetical protein